MSLHTCKHINEKLFTSNTEEETLKLYMNVMFVNKDFLNQVILLSIKELTVITNDIVPPGSKHTWKRLRAFKKRLQPIFHTDFIVLQAMSPCSFVC